MELEDRIVRTFTLNDHHTLLVHSTDQEEWNAIARVLKIQIRNKAKVYDLPMLGKPGDIAEMWPSVDSLNLLLQAFLTASCVVCRRFAAGMLGAGLAGRKDWSSSSSKAAAAAAAGKLGGSAVSSTVARNGFSG